MPRMTERSRARPALKWVLVVGAEAFVILPLLTNGFVYTPTLWLHQLHLLGLAVAGAAGWLAIIWRPSSLSRFLVLAPLPLLGALVLTAFTSSFPSLSWPAAWQMAAYAGIFWLFTLQANNPAGRQRLVAVIAIGVTAALIPYLVSVAIEWRTWIRF